MDKQNTPNDPWKEELKRKLYSAEQDSADLSWDDFQSNLPEQNSKALILHPYRWAAAALFLMTSALFLMLYTQSLNQSGTPVTTSESRISEEPGLTDDQEVPGNLPANKGSKSSDLQSNSINKPAPLKTKKLSYPSDMNEKITSFENAGRKNNTSIINGEYSIVYVSPPDKQPDKAPRTPFTQTRLPTHSVINTISNGSSGSPLISLNEPSEKQFRFNRLNLGIEPLLQYHKLTPETNDLYLINSLQRGNNSAISRFGVNMFASIETDVFQRLSLYSGLSYQYLQNSFKINRKRAISQIQDKKEYNIQIQNISIHAGLKKIFYKNTLLSHAIKLEGGYKHSLSSQELSSTDGFTSSLSYQISFYSSESTTINIEPVITYSSQKIKATSFHLQPYWVGLRMSYSFDLHY